VNQLSWTYLADNGKQHFVGLAHGAETGHLVVHCNSKVVLIDFKVFDNASYSIFIDEQLCEISIEKQGNEYSYGFEIDNQADTPRNRARKKLEKQHLLQSIAFLGTLALVVSIAIFAISRWTSHHDQKNISAKLQRFDQVYQKRNMEGIAHLYFQKTTSSKNSRHNRRTFSRLVEDPAIANSIEKNCGSISFQ